MFSHQKFVSSKSDKSRRGFTLIELMLVIAIIGILTSLALLVIRGAERDALVNRSRAQEQRINQLLASQWEGYQTRILKFRFTDITGGTTLNANQIEIIRNRALMDLARIEFANQIVDLQEFPSPFSQDDPVIPMEQMDLTSLNYWPNAWRDNYLAILNARAPNALIRMRNRMGMVFDTTKANGVERWIPDPANEWTPEYEGAEALYSILESLRIDGTTGIEYVNLRDSEVGDLDGDGFLEVWDAFGEPLNFDVNLDEFEPEIPFDVPFAVYSNNTDGT